MKILMISGSFPNIKCGVGDYTQKLIEHLAKEGIYITVLTSSNVECEINNEHIMVKNCINNWKGIEIINSVMREVNHKYDIVHIQFPTVNYDSKDWGWALIPFILRICGVKSVYTFHEYYDVYYRLPAVVFSNIAIVVENSYKERMNRQYRNLFDSKIHYVRIASSIPRSQSDSNSIQQLRNSIIDGENCKFIISYFGFLNKNKKLELVLEAMHELKLEQKLETKFMIIGDYYAVNQELVEYQDNLKRKILEYNLSEYIFITGYVADNSVGDYFRTSNAALLLFENGVSTRNGSFLAAQQEGITVYTSLPEENNVDWGDNVNFLNNTVEEIKQVFLKVQSKNKSIEVVNGKMNISWEKVTQEHIRLYNQLIN